MAKKFYNLIVLDKSGSMSSIAGQAIAGVNETLGTIRKARRDTGIDQEVTILPFCGCSMDYTVKDADIDSVTPVTVSDYIPCCTTPLLDAIGKGVTNLKSHIGGNPEAAVSVTIITDGYENASREWTYPAVKALIQSLRAEGWLFAFIGANIDVEKVSHDLAINNSFAFAATAEGTNAMFDKEKKSRANWYARRSARMDASIEEKLQLNDEYFDF